jgi:hypothetical protein
MSAQHTTPPLTATPRPHLVHQRHAQPTHAHQTSTWWRVWPDRAVPSRAVVGTADPFPSACVTTAARGGGNATDWASKNTAGQQIQPRECIAATWCRCAIWHTRDRCFRNAPSNASAATGAGQQDGRRLPKAHRAPSHNDQAPDQQQIGPDDSRTWNTSTRAGSATRGTAGAPRQCLQQCCCDAPIWHRQPHQTTSTSEVGTSRRCIHVNISTAQLPWTAKPARLSSALPCFVSSSAACGLASASWNTNESHVGVYVLEAHVAQAAGRWSELGDLCLNSTGTFGP